MNDHDKGIYLLSMAMVMSSEYNLFRGLSFEEMIIAMDEKIMNITHFIAIYTLFLIYNIRNKNNNTNSNDKRY